jgi:hypothetical protein
MIVSLIAETNITQKTDHRNIIEIEIININIGISYKWFFGSLLFDNLDFDDVNFGEDHTYCTF